jgi:hypothetical protein
MPTITCKCGAVELEFYATGDLFRLQCCCHDCRAALWYANKRGGPAPPAHPCVDNSWLPNDFRVVRGEHRIGAFMNFENADTTRFYCKDCWTILFGDHPLYDSKVVVTTAHNYKEYEGLGGISLMPPQARHFMQDLTPDEVAALPPWRGDATHVYAGVADVLISRFPAIQAAGKEGERMNARILLEKTGTVFVPDGEPRLTGGPPTLMQRAASGAGDPA